MDPLETSTGRQAASQSDANPLLIVVPTETQEAHLVSALANLGATAEPSKHGRLTTYHVSSLDAVIARGGLGKTQFAVQTQHLLSVREWSLVINNGAAAGQDVFHVHVHITPRSAGDGYYGFGGAHRVLSDAETAALGAELARHAPRR